jgi:hypothetical protein
MTFITITPHLPPQNELSRRAGFAGNGCVVLICSDGSVTAFKDHACAIEFLRTGLDIRKMPVDN